jgi:hypothetical protein
MLSTGSRYLCIDRLKIPVRERCELIRCKVTALFCSNRQVCFHPKKAKESAVNRSLVFGAFPLFFVQELRKEQENEQTKE